MYIFGGMNYVNMDVILSWQTNSILIRLFSINSINLGIVANIPLLQHLDSALSKYT